MERGKKKKIPNFKDAGASQGYAGGEVSGTRIVGLQGGLGTIKESKEFAAINEANVLSCFACILLCFPTSFTHLHAHMYDRFPEEVSSNNKILRFIRSSPKQQVYVQAECFTWGNSIRYGFGSYICDCAKNHPRCYCL